MSTVSAVSPFWKALSRAVNMYMESRGFGMQEYVDRVLSLEQAQFPFPRAVGISTYLKIETRQELIFAVGKVA